MASSCVFYLKYRPQNLSDLIGQEAVKKNLLSAFTNNKLSHAYLFVGPRGTGKTSTARILAKMVNCELVRDSFIVSSKNDEQTNKLTNNVPCNKCTTCLSITDGSNMDLIEIDAASNRGIEDIRSLRDKIKLAPTSSKKKVYIIDEVHMLTTEAFNALLKTLEEPPDHALFILATTEASKIPQTIISRVQRLDFKLATQEELLQALERIVKEEKVDIDDEALKILVGKSDGSFRDGVKLLDQIASTGGKITVQFIAESFKSSQFEDILDLMLCLTSKDAAKGLLSLGKQLENGIEVKDLVLSLMDNFRKLVLIKNGVGEQLVKPSLTEDKYKSLVEISKSFTNRDLIKNLNVLQKALEQLKFASISSLPLELAMVEICDIGLNLEDTAKQPVIQTVSQIKPAEMDNTDNSAALNEQVGDAIPQEMPDMSPDIVKLKEKWTFVLETIRSVNFSLEALLRSITIAECSANKIVIEVPYAFHQRILESSKNRDLLEGVFSDVLGKSIRISTVLGSRPVKSADIANIEIAQDDEIIRAAAEIFNSDSVN